MYSVNLVNKIRKYYKKYNNGVELSLINYEGYNYYIRIDEDSRKHLFYLTYVDLNRMVKFNKNLINKILIPGQVIDLLSSILHRDLIIIKDNPFRFFTYMIFSTSIMIFFICRILKLMNLRNLQDFDNPGNERRALNYNRNNALRDLNVVNNHLFDQEIKEVLLCLLALQYLHYFYLLNWQQSLNFSNLFHNFSYYHR